MIGALFLAAALFDAGGLTFDFPGLSCARYDEVCFDAEANLLRGETAGATDRQWKRTYGLGGKEGGRFRFSARYKARSMDAPGGGWCQIRAGKFETRRYFVQCGHEWTVMTAPVEIAPGVGEVTVRFVCDKADVEFRDLTLLPEPPLRPVELKAAVMELLDGRYVLSSGSGGLVELYWRKTDPKARYDHKGFTFEIALPAGVDFVDCTFAVPGTVATERRADGSSVTRFRPRRSAVLSGTFNFWEEEGSLVLIKAADGVRGRVGKAVFGCRYELGGERFEAKPVTLEFSVVDPVRAAAPKRYRNGILYGSTNGLDFATRSGFELMSRTCADAGVRWMVARGDESDYAYWRSLGIDRITVPGRRICNSFNICEYGKVPPEDAYVFAKKEKDGTVDLVRRRDAVCPLSVIGRSAYFIRETLPFLKEYINGSDGVWSNWEPWRFEGKGCMCERCMKAFAAFSGRSEDEVRRRWPRAVMKDGGEWYAEAKRFRSLEHARLVRFLDDVVKKSTRRPGSLGLIPGIAWIEMASYGKLNDYAAEVAAVDYAGDLAWMCPWGPYVAWGTNYPFHYRKRAPLCHWFAAVDVVRRTREDYPRGRRPKLLGCVQGYQCGHWVSQPEHISMSLDACFFAGFDSCILFYFPRGYDARFWRAYASATSRAAKYEPFVLDGRRIDDRVAVVPVKAYAGRVRAVSEYLPGVRNVSTLQTASFQHGGRIAVAVMNFWDRAEAFFSLRISGLEEGVWRIVDENGIERVRDDGSAGWTASELSAGVTLEVGAARTRVFEIFRGGTPAALKVTDAMYRRRFAERRAAVEKAVADDALYERLNGEPSMNPMPVL